MVEVENLEEKLSASERFLVTKGYTVEYPKVYRDNLLYRADLIEKIKVDDELKVLVKERCRRDIWYFFNVWLWTPDPRRSVKRLPFITYEYQDEYLWELEEAYRSKYDLLTEKSRDMGASMMMLGFVLHKWLFEDKFSALLGSYLESMVDNKTEDSHFGRLEFYIKSLPEFLMPEKFDLMHHRQSMKLINPQTEAIVTGYAPTDRFSRAGRYNLIFADEFAFWAHGRSAWTAMGDATNVRYVTSTPNGKGNKYAELALGGRIKKVNLHWRRHPLKPESWYEKEKERRTEQEIAQELDIDYNKSITGRVYSGFNEWNYSDYQEYNPLEPLFVSWDFGLSDPTAIIWLQVSKDGTVRLIDAYEKAGQDIYYFVPFVNGVMVSDRQYKYSDEELEMIEKHSKWQQAIHYGDPTGENKNQVLKTSVIRQLRECGIYVNNRRGKDFHFKSRWVATQMLIKRLKVDKRLMKFIDAIENARFPIRSDVSQSTNEIQKPVHDWTSHYRTALEFYAVNENLKVATAGKFEREIRGKIDDIIDSFYGVKVKRNKEYYDKKRGYRTCV